MCDAFFRLFISHNKDSSFFGFLYNLLIPCNNKQFNG